MKKIRGLIIPDEDKKYVSELSKVNPFTYENLDFLDRIPLKKHLLPETIRKVIKRRNYSFYFLPFSYEELPSLKVISSWSPKIYI